MGIVVLAFSALRAGLATVNVVQTAYNAVQAITNALMAANPSSSSSSPLPCSLRASCWPTTRSSPSTTRLDLCEQLVSIRGVYADGRLKTRTFAANTSTGSPA